MESGQIDAIEYELWDEYFTTRRYDEKHPPAVFFDYPDSLDNLELAVDPVSPAKDDLSGKSGLSTDFSYRYYQNISENSSRREHAILRGSYNGNISWYLESEKKDPVSDHYFRRRFISVSGNKYEAVLGNFEPDWGMGVTLGRHCGFLDKDDNPLYNSILYPYMGRYNGLKLKYNSRISPVVMLSYDRSEKSRGRLAAFGLDYGGKDAAVGVMSGYHKIDNLNTGAEYSNRVMGAFLSAGFGDYSLKAELSESEGKYLAGCFELKKKYVKGSFILSGWNYPERYINPYGEGPSNSDYESIDIEDTEIEYRSRQNGEWGFLAKTSFRLFTSHRSTIAANYWCDGGLEEKYRAKISDRWEFKRSFDIVLTYLWGDDNLDDSHGDRQHFRLDFICGKRTDKRLRVSAEMRRIYYESGRRDYLRAEIKGTYATDENLKTVVKISRIDYDVIDSTPGYWLIYLGEDITLAKYICMRTALDTREGENYNLIDAARINLQLSFTL